MNGFVGGRSFAERKHRTCRNDVRNRLID